MRDRGEEAGDVLDDVVLRDRGDEDGDVVVELVLRDKGEEAGDDVEDGAELFEDGAQALFQGFGLDALFEVAHVDAVEVSGLV